VNSDRIQKIEQFSNFDNLLIFFGREKSLFYLVGGHYINQESQQPLIINILIYWEMVINQFSTGFYIPIKPRIPIMGWMTINHIQSVDPMIK
jgi:hypothetical protein